MLAKSPVKILWITCFMFAGLYMHAQDATPVKPPVYPSGTPRSFIRTWEASSPETDPNVLITKDVRDAKQSTEYIDGLGRTLQTVVRKGSLATGGAPTDLVIPRVYDPFGKEVRKYLPFAAAQNTGDFKLDAFDQQKTFYDAHLAGQGETFYYNKTDYEASTLNNVLKTFAAGNSWVNQGRATETKESYNSSLDEVRRWTVTDIPGSWATYSMTGWYQIGELLKVMSTDENGKQIIEFKDKDDKLVLRKVQLTSSPDVGNGIGHGGWLCTYYVFDNMKNLRLVIQPRGVELLISANWDIYAYNNEIINEQCFRYEYDEYNRLSMKKVPGKGEVWNVYDQWDRLVLTQDANLRQQAKWIFTKYDHLDRPIITGFYSYLALSQSSMQQYVNGQNMARFENYNAASFPLYSLNLTFPVVSFSDILTITYFDDYSWSSWYGNYGSKDNSFDSYFTLPASSYPYALPLSQSTNVRGKVTGVWDNASKLVANYYDDKGRVIQTKTYMPYAGGGVEVLTTQYSFSGLVLQTALYQPNNTGGTQTHLVITKFEYDDLGRLASVKKSINSSLPGGVNISKPEVEIVKNEYDKLGQLKHKNLGKKKDAAGNYTSTPLEVLTYDYNIRGWVIGMNRDFVLTSNGTSSRLFGFELGYDKAVNKAGRNFTAALQYNGNITGLIWKTNGDGIRRKYDFAYDKADRLLEGTFEQHDESGAWGNSLVNYTSKAGDGVNPTTAYDANGNIKLLQQWGLKITGSTQTDNMVYSYYNNNNSNKLQAVQELGSGASDHKLGDFTDNNTTGTDYGYDKNGNLVTDLNRRINGATGTAVTSGGGITYNHLNLPVQVVMKDNNGNTKGTISYIYDASGNKLRKTVVEAPSTASNNREVTTVTTYMGSFVYESKSYNPADPDRPNYTDRLQYINHEEGRIRFKPAEPTWPASLEYDYFVKDHIGNIRLVISDEQQKDLYPAATLEGSLTTGDKSMVNYEKRFYTVNNAYVVNKSSIPSWSAGLDYQNNNGNPPANNNYPADHTFSPTGVSDRLYKLNATTNKTGLGFVIKVMAGDRIDIHGKSYYHSNQTFNNSNSTALILTDIISAFLGTPNNPAVSKGVTPPQMEGWNNGPNGIPGSFIRGSNGESVTVPKAYINYMLFDDQFRFAGTGGFSRAGSSGVVKNHWFADAALQNISVTKNGYLYVYVSNESNVDVFFDNLQVIHTRGALLEETHYYPFGLTMAGISSEAVRSPYADNKKGYNGNELQHKEFSDGTGLEFYDFNARSLDQQLGRFLQIDPESEEANQEDWSPYHFGYNNPIRYGDPDGKFPIPLIVIGVKFLVGAAVEYGSQVVENYQSGKRGADMWKPQGWGGAGKIFLNGATSTVDPSGGLVRKFAINTGTNIVESVGGQMLDKKPVTFEKTFSDVLVNTVSSNVKVDHSKNISSLDNKATRLERVNRNNPKPTREAAANEARKDVNNAKKFEAVSNTATTETTESYLQKKADQARGTMFNNNWAQYYGNDNRARVDNTGRKPLVITAPPKYIPPPPPPPASTPPATKPPEKKKT